MTPSPGARDGSRRRIVQAGIDEAGLGPLLGPLAIGYAAMSLPSVEADAWRLLSKVVARKIGKSRRLVVADSKKVYTRNERGWARLETTVLAFLAQLDPSTRPPADPGALVFGPVAPGRAAVDAHPWYAGLLAQPLPRAAESASLELRAALLARELEAAGAALLDAGVRLVPAGELNASYEVTGNKGATVWSKCREVLRHLWTAHSHDDLHVTVDLLGGRIHYGRLLEEAFPGTEVEVLSEGDHHSRYRLVERDEDGRNWLPRQMALEFRARGEEASFTVALASCLAKYSRELTMHAFNAYFEERSPGLRPTAGYTTDGRRWLKDAEGCLRTAGLERSLLVRTR